MNTAGKLFIHVGLRKTATTWLQEFLFKEMKEINYIGKTEENYPEWMIRWHYLDDYAFEKEKHEIRNILQSLMNREKINLISSEAFTNAGVIYNQALRIKGVFQDAKIIVTFRNPIDMVRSHYRHDVAEGESFLNINEYLDWKRTPFYIGKRKPIYLPDFFLDEIKDIYFMLFGANNVCVLKYEDMIDCPEKFFSQLGAFLGVTIPDLSGRLTVRVNEGAGKEKLLSKKAENFMNFLQRFFPALASKVSLEDIKADAGDFVMDEETQRRLKEYYRGKASDYLL